MKCGIVKEQIRECKLNTVIYPMLLVGKSDSQSTLEHTQRVSLPVTKSLRVKTLTRHEAHTNKDEKLVIRQPLLW